MKKARKEAINSKRIKIELRNGYYVDSNRLLKGEWGGFHELNDRGPHGEAMFEIYYSHFSRRIPINEFGFFYNKFSCKKYDGVIELPIPNLYICEKNGQFGLINTDEKDILPIAYEDIDPFFVGVFTGYGLQYHYLSEEVFYSSWKYKNDDNIFFIVKTESGKFLFNLSTQKRSAVYDDIYFSSEKYHPQIIYKCGYNYGAIDVEGNELLKPIYEYNNLFPRRLYYRFQDSVFNVWVEDGLLYGEIPYTEYDVCFKVDNHFICKKGNKYGLINKKQERVSELVLDEILLYQHHENSRLKGCMCNQYYSKKEKMWISASFIIAREGAKYKLFNLDTGHLILDNCESINYKYSGESVVEFLKGDIRGYVIWNEAIISTVEYEDLSTVNGFIYVKKSNKYGVFTPSGEELFPCVYDKILDSWGGRFTLIQDGEVKKIDPYLKKRSGSHCSYDIPTYGKYAGSYAQDEMGYSDDDIDTIFDGDPSAYWNID